MSHVAAVHFNVDNDDGGHGELNPLSHLGDAHPSDY